MHEPTAGKRHRLHCSVAAYLDGKVSGGALIAEQLWLGLHQVCQALAAALQGQVDKGLVLLHRKAPHDVGVVVGQDQGRNLLARYLIELRVYGMLSAAHVLMGKTHRTLRALHHKTAARTAQLPQTTGLVCRSSGIGSALHRALVVSTRAQDCAPDAGCV